MHEGQRAQGQPPRVGGLARAQAQRRGERHVVALGDEREEQVRALGQVGEARVVGGLERPQPGPLQASVAAAARAARPGAGELRGEARDRREGRAVDQLERERGPRALLEHQVALARARRERRREGIGPREVAVDQRAQAQQRVAGQAREGEAPVGADRGAEDRRERVDRHAERERRARIGPRARRAPGRDLAPGEAQLVGVQQVALHRGADPELDLEHARLLLLVPGRAIERERRQARGLEGRRTQVDQAQGPAADGQVDLRQSVGVGVRERDRGADAQGVARAAGALAQARDEHVGHGRAVGAAHEQGQALRALGGELAQVERLAGQEPQVVALDARAARQRHQHPQRSRRQPADDALVGRAGADAAHEPAGQGGRGGRGRGVERQAAAAAEPQHALVRHAQRQAGVPERERFLGRAPAPFAALLVRLGDVVRGRGIVGARARGVRGER